MSTTPNEKPSARWRVMGIMNAGLDSTSVIHRRTGMPEHYGLSFRRQFDVGESGHMVGLELSISVAAADELRALRASL